MSVNNIKALRLKAGLTQPALAAACREADCRIETAMISRFENGVCLPTPSVAKAIAAALQVPVEALYGVPDQMYIPAVLMADAPVEPESMDVTNIVNALASARRPLTRKELCAITGMCDRSVRQSIADARLCGYIIVGGDRSKGGYYIAASMEDVERHFHREESRALSILKGLSAARRRLKEEGKI